jgi:phosphoribosylamine--glycine ligase
MKSLLVGNGAREHAVAEQMAKGSELYAFMSANNPGIRELSKDVAIGNTKDAAEVVAFAQKVNPDYVFIGPEDPLARGVGDALEDTGFKVAGPRQAVARLESDKGFCRELMAEKVPEGCPKFVICNDVDTAMAAIDEFETDIVVKPAGLTGGKGVQVQGIHLHSKDDVKDYTKKVISESIGGSSYVVLEEKLEGEEFTLQVYTDGKKVVGMPIVQDHKLAFEGDTGPMTGGMGSYSDADFMLPFVNEKDKEVALKVIEKTLHATYEKTGEYYKGVLYGQFMLTRDGPKIIEYNVRFGDPEAMNVLPILKSDFSEICMSMIDGNLKTNLDFEKVATVCKYLVPKGYPTNPESGAKVEISPNTIKDFGANLYYASVDQRDDAIYTSSSRSFGIVGMADNIPAAESIAQKAVESVKCEKLFFRSDIGKESLIQKRIKHMGEIRG